MAGNVYLRTNRFEVQLEGITFKRRDFEYLCSIDFLFPEGRVWDLPPIVGLDVMPHPRDPSVLLLLLSVGVGCVILRFAAGEPLPPPIRRFLSDRRIQFVGFGIADKASLFPFKELGLVESRVDIGNLAAKALKRPECRTWELPELARKVLGIKRMVGLTEASEDERHERIKCAICQLFITSVIAMELRRADGKDDKNKKKKKKQKKVSASHSHGGITSTILKKLDGGWFRLPKGRRRSSKKDEKPCVAEEEAGDDSVHVHLDEIQMDDVFAGDDSSPSEDDLGNDSGRCEREVEGVFSDNGSKTLKGILKCPSTHLVAVEPTSTMKDSGTRSCLRRANSKGCNVSFKCQ